MGIFDDHNIEELSIKNLVRRYLHQYGIMGTGANEYERLIIKNIIIKFTDNELNECEFDGDYDKYIYIDKHIYHADGYNVDLYFDTHIYIISNKGPIKNFSRCITPESNWLTLKYIIQKFK